MNSKMLLAQRKETRQEDKMGTVSTQIAYCDFFVCFAYFVVDQLRFNHQVKRSINQSRMALGDGMAKSPIQFDALVATLDQNERPRSPGGRG